MKLVDRRAQGTDPEEPMEPCSHADLRVVLPAESRRSGSGALLRTEFRVLGFLCVVVGVLLFLEEMGMMDGVHRLWPVFPAVLGVGFVLMFFQRGRVDLILMGLGSYLVGISVLFLACNYSSWGILVRLWPVFIGMVGLSSVISSAYARRIRRVMWLSGTFLVLLSIVFLLVFGLYPGFWPVSLMLFGLWIFLLTWARNRAGKRGQ